MNAIRIIALFFLLLIVTAFAPPAYADIPLPEYVNAKCDIGEQMIECQNSPGLYAFGNPGNLDRNAYINSLLFSSINKCQKYDNNPSYRKLASDAHGVAKYCYKNSQNFSQTLLMYFFYYFLAVLITVIFELPIYLKLGHKSKDNIKQILLINAITVVALNLSLRFFLPLYGGLIKILFLELIVIFIEGLYLNTRLRINSLVASLLISAWANIFSATIGYLALYTILKSLRLA